MQMSALRTRHGRLQWTAVAIAVAATLGACGDGPTPPERVRVAAHIVPISGPGQPGIVNTLLPSPFTVEIRDSAHRPLAGVAVAFQVLTGGGGILPALVFTGADGRASANWTLGPSVGSQRASATAAGIVSPLEIAVTASPGPAAAISIVSGSGQSAVVGSALPAPFSVRVADAWDNPVAGVTVTFAVTAGGGSLSASTVVTNAEGLAESRLTLGAAAGANTVTATVPGIAPVTFTSTAFVNDTERIAFVTPREGPSAIWLIKPDGTGLTHVTDLSDRVANPSWSPDGSRLVFEDYLGTNNTELYAINRDGTGRTRLTYTAEEESNPAWSPDGTRIAFVLARGAPGTNGIWVMNADGTNRQMLIPGSFQDDPAWSPDGTRLAFTRTYIENNTTNLEIVVANADGTNEVRLTNVPGNDLQPAWSPDGSQMAFASDRTHPLKLWLMNADGSNQREITAGITHINVSTPSWSPDGSRISFSSLAGDGEELRSIRPDGTGLVTLTDELSYVREGAWSPR